MCALLHPSVWLNIHMLALWKEFFWQRLWVSKIAVIYSCFLVHIRFLVPSWVGVPCLHRGYIIDYGWNSATYVISLTIMSFRHMGSAPLRLAFH